MPANQDDAPTPLSRYSSSENVLRLDGGSNSSGSVAEKAMMFELTANIQNSRNTSPMPKSNGTSDDQRSPRFSSSPRRNKKENKKQTNEKNSSVKNLSNGDDKSSNFQDLLTQQLLANKSWSELMDSES